MHPSGLVMNDGPNEPPVDKRDYELRAREEKDKPAPQYPTHKPNRHRLDHSNFPNSHVANRDGGTPIAFANVAALNYQSRAERGQECDSSRRILPSICCRMLKKTNLFTRPTLAATTPAHPEAAKTTSLPRDAPFHRQ